VIRPSESRFEEYRELIREGNYKPGSGWGDSRIGNFWGGQTIQGIIPYFYHSIHPGDAVELNGYINHFTVLAYFDSSVIRCVYNCMVDNPYRPNTQICLNGEPTCQDCRIQKPELVKSAHFTICQKPWTCTEHLNVHNRELCRALHKKWFELRDEFEREYNLDMTYRTLHSKHVDSLGMCSRYGDSGYHRIPVIL
jgi:hypothetical protein